MKLGAMQHVLGGSSDIERFSLARELGFAGVEAVILRNELAKPSRLHQLIDAQGTTGIQIPSLCFAQHNGLIAQAAQTRSAIAELTTGIDWARQLGAAVILLPFFFEGELKTREDFEVAVAGFTQLCAIGEEAKVTITYEGTYDAAMCRKLADAIKSPAFGIYFDLANVVWLGMDGPSEIR